MPTTFDKLILKDHKEILVLNAPDTFEKEIRGLCDVRVFRRIEDMKALAFAKSQLTMLVCSSLQGASSSSSSPSSSHGNHATKWHLVTRLLGLPPVGGVT
jgi:hypothetical protein